MMAVFHHHTGECSDCGEWERCVETNLFVSNGLLPSSGDAESLCFGCYLNRLDRRGEAYRRVVTAEPIEGEVVVGAVKRSGDAERVAGRLENLLGLEVSHHSIGSLYGDAMNSGSFGEAYLRELARGIGSVNRDVYTSVGPGSHGYPVLDFTSFVRREVRGSLVRKAAARIRESPGYSRVSKRGDVERLVRDELPLLGDHGFGGLVEASLWRRLKERDSDVLGSRSKTAMQNQVQGRGFEEFFEDLCERRGVSYYRDSAAEFRRRHPADHRRLEGKCPGLRGMPDYLVVGDGGFGDGWRPAGTGFVEVKYRGSRLSGRQKRVVAHLKSQGYPVWVLRGEPEEYRFDRR